MNSITSVTPSFVSSPAPLGQVAHLLSHSIQPKGFPAISLGDLLKALHAELIKAKIIPLKIEIFGSAADFIDRGAPYHDIDIRIEVAENLGSLIYAFKEHVSQGFASAAKTDFMGVFNYGVKQRHLEDKKSSLVSVGDVDLLCFIEKGLARKHFAISDAMSYDILPILEGRNEAKFLTEGFDPILPRLERQERLLTIDHPETVYHNGFIRLIRLCTQGERLNNLEAAPILLQKHIEHCNALAEIQGSDLPHASLSYMKHVLHPYFGNDSAKEAECLFNAFLNDCPLPFGELPELFAPLFQIYKKLTAVGISQRTLNEALAVFLFLSGKKPEPFFLFKEPDFETFQQEALLPLAPLRDLFLSEEEFDLKVVAHVTPSYAWKLYQKLRSSDLKRRCLGLIAENAVRQRDMANFQKVCQEAKKQKVPLNKLLLVDTLRTFLPYVTTISLRLELAQAYLQSGQPGKERTALLIQEIKAHAPQNAFLLFKRFGKVHFNSDERIEMATFLFNAFQERENIVPATMAFLIESGIQDPALILKMACQEAASVYLPILLERCHTQPLQALLKIAELWRHYKSDALKPALIEKIASLLLASLPHVEEAELQTLLNDFSDVALGPREGLQKAFESWVIRSERNLALIEQLDSWCPLSIATLNELLNKTPAEVPSWLAERVVGCTADPRVAVTLYHEANWKLLISQLQFAKDWEVVLLMLGHISEIKSSELKALYQLIQPYLNQIPSPLLVSVLERLQATSVNLLLLRNYDQIAPLLSPENLSNFERGFLSPPPSQLSKGEKHKKELLLVLRFSLKHLTPIPKLLKPCFETEDSEIHEEAFKVIEQNIDIPLLESLQNTRFKKLGGKRLLAKLNDRSQPLGFSGWQKTLDICLQTASLFENDHVELGKAFLNFLLDHSSITFDAISLNNYMQRFYLLFSRPSLALTKSEMTYSYGEEVAIPKCWVMEKMVNKTVLQTHLALIKAMILMMIARYAYASKNASFLTFLVETVEKNFTALLEHHAQASEQLLWILNEYILSIPPEAGNAFIAHRERAKKMLTKALGGNAILQLGSPAHFCYHLYLTGSTLSSVVTSMAGEKRLMCIQAALNLIWRLNQKKNPESLFLALICSEPILYEMAMFPEPPDAIPDLFDALYKVISAYPVEDLSVLKKHIEQMNHLVHSVIGILALGHSHKAKYYQPLIVVRYLKALNGVALQHPTLVKPFEPELILNLLKKAAEEDAFRGDYSIFYEAITLLFPDFVHKVGQTPSDPPEFDEITKLICAYPYQRPLQEDKALKSRAETLKTWLELLKLHNPQWAEVLTTQFDSVKVITSF